MAAKKVARKSSKKAAKKSSPAARRRRTSGPSGKSRFFLLDMGKEQYGDCLVCRFGERTVMIDAGHPSDFSGQTGYDSIPEQLGKILGGQAPFEIDLLIVTHGHNDHIGCLPKLVSEDAIRPKYAIVADPDLAFPPGYRDALGDELDGEFAKVVAGLLEEDHSFLSDAQLEEFLDAVAKLGQKYRDAIEKLDRDGTTIFKWGSTDPAELAPIYEMLAGTGFDIIGPAVPQLEICRDQIIAYARKARKAAEDVLSTLPADAPADASLLYKRILLGDPSMDALPLIDRKGTGSALNCQSLVIKFGEGDEKVLLAGDMQFADSEVDGLTAELADLRRKVVDAGPYHFVKMTHHTSKNGIDESLWEDLGRPPLLAHSGGSNDSGHPDSQALAYLKDLQGITFARTDRNGMISVDPGGHGAAAFKTSRGDLNDFSVNRRRRGRDETASSLPPTGIPWPPTEPEVTGRASSLRPLEPLTSGGADFVDLIFAKIPYRDGHMTIDGHTIEIRRPPSAGAGEIVQVREPADPSRSIGPRTRAASARRLASGRALSSLLFVTDKQRLARNVGREEAAQILKMIQDGDGKLLGVDGGAPERAVTSELATGKYKGVVVVGGYDVLKSQSVDVLDPALRGSLNRRSIAEDQDEFIVWSDEIYGDADGDGLAELPVSRIPDGKTPELVLTALAADKPVATADRFGICNAARPFSFDIYDADVPGTSKYMTSGPNGFRDVDPGRARQAFLYFMLHGLDRDGSRFWGDGRSGAIEAINTGILPRSGLGVVFAGCCWGALTVDQRANDTSNVVSPKTPEGSMALACLAAGALAFVGCTGVHYSPGPAGGFFGGPMHRAFWKILPRSDFSPAKALFEARKAFLAEMPHGRTAPLELAIERKIYRQFTCLGLGW
ncbi:MBL fold metallo-hydrolase [Bradyrhizobium brasilense]|uniref:MBL fold metallo-hydrolase n=1 Tax=Bradyrhizobium brasilense TaxID=1419277 RepID=A0ABY8JAG5_9BRAD|nr:MBL fold metallo-hydrolase [Bradyrhizobium brasilense]WFU62481.1 MBL fold metallo-hydrolase [Bradyrhizobium brasilense]